MGNNVTQQNDSPVNEFLRQLEPASRKSCERLVSIMASATGCQPKMWGANIVGLGTYHYKYSSGHSGDSCIAGFSPRKGKISIYVMDGAGCHADLLAKLGKHKIGKACITLSKPEY